VIAFRLSCVPPKTSHHAKRIVKMGKFSRLADKPELNEAKQLLDSLLLSHQPKEPMAGAVCLRLEYTWPWLKGHGKQTRALGRIPMTSRPDCSNLAKTLEDRLVALRFIDDDNAVVQLMVLKFWGAEPGIWVQIMTCAESGILTPLQSRSRELFTEDEPHRPSLSEA
jgi:Holliday junction resolvase RusA-like endonuclease